MPDELAPGDLPRAGDYRLLSELGSGRLGRSFLGLSPDGRLVAVRFIQPGLAGTPGFRARFTRDVAAAKTVRSAFAAPVLDAGPDGPQPWLVTAYIDGPSLAGAVARHGPMPTIALLPLAAGLAEGLAAIHAAGVVHGDLKPSNVLLASDGPRITGFGVPAVTGAAGAHAGSPGFLSPEQAAGGAAGPASDIFSLGGVLIFAATGTGPFGTGTPDALRRRMRHSRPGTSRLPAQIRAIAERCLARDPRQRPSAGELLADLGTAATPEGRWLPWPPARPPAQPPPQTAAMTPPQTAAMTPPQTAAMTPPQTAAMTLPAPPEQVPPAGRHRPRSRPQLRWGLTAGGLTAVLAVAGTFSVSHWSTAASGSPAAMPQSPPAAARAAQPAPASPVPASPASASPAPAAAFLPAQPWRRYRDPSGFSVSLPAGWAVSSRTPTEVSFTGIPPGFAVVIDSTTHPQPDALADWQRQAAARARSDPTYQQISLGRAAYRGLNAADWEFTYISRGEPIHVIDRTFIVRPGHLAYAVELSGPAAGWAPVFARMWNRLLASFQPAG